MEGVCYLPLIIVSLLLHHHTCAAGRHLQHGLRTDYLTDMHVDNSKMMTRKSPTQLQQIQETGKIADRAAGLLDVESTLQQDIRDQLKVLDKHANDLQVTNIGTADQVNLENANQEKNTVKHESNHANVLAESDTAIPTAIDKLVDYISPEKDIKNLESVESLFATMGNKFHQLLASSAGVNELTERVQQIRSHMENLEASKEHLMKSAKETVGTSWVLLEAFKHNAKLLGEQINSMDEEKGEIGQLLLKVNAEKASDSWRLTGEKFELRAYGNKLASVKNSITELEEEAREAGNGSLENVRVLVNPLLVRLESHEKMVELVKQALGEKGA